MSNRRHIDRVKLAHALGRQLQQESAPARPRLPARTRACCPTPQGQPHIPDVCTRIRSTR